MLCFALRFPDNFALRFPSFGLGVFMESRGGQRGPISVRRGGALRGQRPVPGFIPRLLVLLVLFTPATCSLPCPVADASVAWPDCPSSSFELSRVGDNFSKDIVMAYAPGR
jgi:hypothetical protein